MATPLRTGSCGSERWAGDAKRGLHLCTLIDWCAKKRFGRLRSDYGVRAVFHVTPSMGIGEHPTRWGRYQLKRSRRTGGHEHFVASARAACRARCGCGAYFVRVGTGRWATSIVRVSETLCL